MDRTQARFFTVKDERVDLVPDKEFLMKSFTKCISAALAIALLAGTAIADDTVSAGKIKSINADNKTFIVTDAADKDRMFTLGDHLVVNRGNKEGKNDLKAGDVVSICHSKDPLTLTAHYILVQDGTTKKSELVRGNVKSYDADNKKLVFTGENGKSSTFSMGDARVRLNMKDSKVEDVKIGDHALLIVEMIEDTPTLRSVMVDRKSKD